MLVSFVLLLNLIAIWLEFRFRSPFVVFPAGLLMVYSLPHMANVSLSQQYSASTYSFVSMWGALFFAFYIFFRVILGTWIRKRLSVARIYHYQDVQEKRLLIVLAVMAVMLFALAYDFSIGRMLSQNWGQQREAVGLAFLLASYLVYLCSGVSIYATSFGGMRGGFVLLAFIVLMALILKSRSYILAMSMPAVIYAAYANRITPKKMVGAVVAICLIGGLFVLTRGLRHVGSIQELTLEGLLFATNDSGFGEQVLIDAFYYYVESNIDPAYSISMRNAGLVRLFSIFLPGVVTPQDVSYAVWNVYTGASTVNGSFHPTAIADSFINDRDFGFIIYPAFYAVLFSLSEFFIVFNRRFRIALFSVSAFVAIYFSRGAFSNGMAILVVSFGFFYVSWFVVEVWNRLKGSRSI
jgi:hypothetical protein